MRKQLVSVNCAWPQSFEWDDEGGCIRDSLGKVRKYRQLDDPKGWYVLMDITPEVVLRPQINDQPIIPGMETKFAMGGEPADWPHQVSEPYDAMGARNWGENSPAWAEASKKALEAADKWQKKMRLERIATACLPIAYVWSGELSRGRVDHAGGMLKMTAIQAMELARLLIEQLDKDDSHG